MKLRPNQKKQTSLCKAENSQVRRLQEQDVGTGLQLRLEWNLSVP